MKKDKRFLNNLEKELSVLKEKDRSLILQKYRDIIDDGLANKKKITTILKEIGPVKLVALNEIEAIKSQEKDNVFKRFFNFITRDLTNKDEDKIAEQKKLKEEKKKEKELRLEERRKEKEAIRAQKQLEKEKREKEKKKLDDEKKALDEKIKEEKRKQKEALKNASDEEKAKIKEKQAKEKQKAKEEKKKLAEEKKALKTKIKEEKRKQKAALRNASKEEKEELKKAKKEKDKFLKEEKKKLKELEAEEKKKAKDNKKDDNIVSETVEKVEEVFEDITADAVEEITEKHIFESKEARRKRIILTTLGVILTIILIFIWLWITVIAIACGFAYLDGVKFVGLIIAAFGIDFLWLWIVVMINRAVFHKKNSLRLNLIIVFVCVALIALGIVLFVRKLYSIKTVEDVSDKYSMTTKYDTYMLPSDSSRKLSVMFNSNYKTQYIVDYDENMLGKVKVEVKYYEAYYDYFIKKSSNIVYVSLKVDDRDRLSTYISDIKDGVIYDSDEMARYIVKITMSEEDKNRIEIIN